MTIHRILCWLGIHVWTDTWTSWIDVCVLCKSERLNCGSFR